MPHLFKFGNVNGLLATHPFEHGNVGRLLNTHFFETAIVCLRPLQLLLEHRHVRLQTHADFTFTLDFRFNCTQMLQFDELRLQTSLLVSVSDLARRGDAT